MPNPVNKIMWTDEMIDFVKLNHQSLNSTELASHLKIGRTKLREKCYELGLYKMQLEYWIKEQIDFLLTHYKLIGDTELAVMYNQRWKKNKGWTKKHIEKKRRLLNLKRTNAEKKTIFQRNKEAGAWAMCSIKAWQKRGVAKNGELRVFKIVGRQVVHIKTTNGFIWYSRYLWEKQNGKIPEGMMLRTKDNNSLNIVIENLELIDAAENARRNIAIKMAKNPDLRRANYLLNKIKKTIKTHEQH